MIKDFMTAYWGYLPPTTKPYPASAKVNAFVGESGHGKTTIWDALRLILGDTTFENKRNIGHYVHPESNWAIIRVGFDNRSVKDRRSFDRYNMQEDLVVACCRVFKVEGLWKKEYYVFDGEFTDLEGLSKNPKAYKERLFKYETYRAMLEECLGISPAFKRLMAMNPESVRDMISLTPNQLFTRIFELKGIKDIQKKYNDAKLSLNEQELKCKDVEEALEEAKVKFQELKQKADKYEQFKRDEVERNTFLLKAHKLEYWETEEQIKSVKQGLVDTKKEIDTEQDNINKLGAQIKKVEDEVSELKKQQDEQGELAREARDKCSEIRNQLQKPQVKLAQIQDAIGRLHNIEPQDMETLAGLLELAEDEKGEIDGQLWVEKNELWELKQRLADLKANKPAYPSFVDRYIKKLREARTDFIMLAEAINVKPEFQKWQVAVEAYLGNNRYRVIVPPEQYLAAKELQQDCKYTARVSTPKGEKRPVQKPRVNYPTIRSVINISCPEKVAGYLENLDQVYLVDTVKEGHKLQSMGFVSITREGLQQDNDGAIFRKYGSLCCGNLAVQASLEQVLKELPLQEEKVQQLDQKSRQLKKEIGRLNTEIGLQEELKNLPGYRQEESELTELVAGLQSQLESWENKEQAAQLQKDNLGEQRVEINGDLSKKKAQFKYTEEKVGQLNKKYLGLQEELFKLEDSRDEKINYLVTDCGLSEEDIEFISVDVKGAGFKNDQGVTYKSKELFARCEDLRRKIEFFKEQYPDVNESILQLVKGQDVQVGRLEESLRMFTEEREKWEEQCDIALRALRNHIKDTMKEYINSFKMLADLMGAKALGVLREQGEMPELWELAMAIGFDSKEPVPIDGPDLSSGQRACTSLMLLLAAINSQDEVKKMPIMFLDEPRARVDDARGNEIGQLLQVTDCQYFITHQHGESLKSIDWINNSFSVSVRKPGNRFAPPLIFKKMRS